MNIFTVIIPAYNAEKCIGRSIQSVLTQKYEDFELFIVDDGSTDKTYDVINHFDDPRIHLITKENGGVSQARNMAIEKSSAPYVCFLDADDEWYPNHLSILYDAVKKYADKNFFATTSITELKNGTLQESTPRSLNGNISYFRNYFEFEQVYGYVFNTNCVCIKRNMLNLYGVFEEGVKVSEDIDLWYRILLHTGIVLIPTATNMRHRDYSVATRQRYMNPVTIFWTRVPKLLQDNSIDPDIRKSLSISFEQQKISVARSLILNKKKRAAYKKLREIDKTCVSKMRYWATFISLLLPACFIRFVINYRDRNYFDS